MAVLENLVHWQTVALPPSLVCVRVTIPRGLDQERIDDLDSAALAADDFMTTRALGNRWYARGRTAVLWVPSVVSPYESNVLFNQRHADFTRLEVD
ncbi:MAG: RES domain-containing protein, partial [Acidobacteria bacterium]|nr:RES domain-containing protein [Acidobacteriota bacterium]